MFTIKNTESNIFERVKPLFLPLRDNQRLREIEH